MARRYCATGIVRASVVDTIHLVVTHVAGAAMLWLRAQRDGALDHVQLGCACPCAIHDVAHHPHAGKLLEWRSLASDDFERCNADARQVRNRAQSTRAVWQTLGRGAAAIAVHVPDPLAIVGQVTAEPALAPRSEHATGPFEFGAHF